MSPAEHFRFCPKCGQPTTPPPAHHPLTCGSCGFVFYFNPAIAAGALILDPQDRALFIRRSQEPAQGKLAIPGGFIDAGETAESALRREVREEVNLEVGHLQYLGAFPNLYPYKGVTYPVLDFFFVAKTTGPVEVQALDGVAGYSWIEPSKVPLESIAFPSVQAAIREYIRQATV